MIVKKLFYRFRVSCRDLIEFFALDQISFPAHFLIKVKLLSVLYNVHCNLHADCSPEQVQFLINAAVSVTFQG